MKIKDYPFQIKIENKISGKGNQYTSIGIGITSVKDKDAKTAQDKYKTDWLNLIDKRDLLKLGTLCLNAYQQWTADQNKPQDEKKVEVSSDTNSYPDLDSDIPF
jgi:hypothetical protein